MSTPTDLGIPTMDSNPSAPEAIFSAAMQTINDLIASVQIPFCYSGKPANNQRFTYKAGKKVLFPAGLTGSQFSIGTNPTATLAITLAKNGSTIGNLSISTSGVFTVTFASDVTFLVGDIFTATAPSSADATGADIAMTFMGTLKG
jgi:hypothetical protein